MRSLLRQTVPGQPTTTANRSGWKSLGTLCCQSGSCPTCPTMCVSAKVHSFWREHFECIRQADSSSSSPHKIVFFPTNLDVNCCPANSLTHKSCNFEISANLPAESSPKEINRICFQLKRGTFKSRRRVRKPLCKDICFEKPTVRFLWAFGGLEQKSAVLEAKQPSHGRHCLIETGVFPSVDSCFLSHFHIISTLRLRLFDGCVYNAAFKQGDERERLCPAPRQISPPPACSIPRLLIVKWCLATIYDDNACRLFCRVQIHLELFIFAQTTFIH